jgi:hypothetical protein
MNILQVFQLIALALSAVKQVQDLYTEAHSGAVKKETAVSLFLSGVDAAKVAGAPISDQTSAQLAPIAGDIIEHAVTIARSVGILPSPAQELGH